MRPETTIELFDLRGTPGDQGLLYGRSLRELGLLGSSFAGDYIAACGRVTRTNPDDVRTQAEIWLASLPMHHQDEVEGMARGAGVSLADAATFLYADIARPSDQKPTGDVAWASPAQGDAAGTSSDLVGPMCSALLCQTDDRSSWVARNCDWLTVTLTRGTAAVCHRTRGRVPTLAVGIRGDIDVDTGMNAAGLWLHLHTLYTVKDEPNDARLRISWLFWCREALETCETLDELEGFIQRTTRDRGVIAVALDGKTGEGAAFECSRSAHIRRDFDPAQPSPMVITNHALDKAIDESRRAKSKPAGTIARACRLREVVTQHPPEYGPDDLAEALGDPAVEMDRRPASDLVRSGGPSPISTIYSAACRPGATARETEFWFAAGETDGRPAASGGSWARVEVPW